MKSSWLQSISTRLNGHKARYGACADPVGVIVRAQENDGVSLFAIDADALDQIVVVDDRFSRVGWSWHEESMFVENCYGRRINSRCEVCGIF